MTAQGARKRNPFAGLFDIVSDMNRMLGTRHGVEPRDETQPRSHVNAWTPAMDIAAIGDELVIDVELAGVAEEDLQITYTAPILTIAGQRQLPDGTAGEAIYHTKEVSRGRFRRTVTLPAGIGRDDIAVALRRGMLTITVRRRGEGDDSGELPIGHEQHPVS